MTGTILIFIACVLVTRSAGRLGRMTVVGVVVGLVAALSIVAVIPDAASADTFRWTCQSGAEASSNDAKWQEGGPYQISISPATILSISRRVGRFEGESGGAPEYVPCVVAESVAYNGMRAWQHNWMRNNGWIGAGWIGAASGPWFGSFYCAGSETATSVYSETCTHHADRHAGRIIVRFTIMRAPAPLSKS